MNWSRTSFPARLVLQVGLLLCTRASGQAAIARHPQQGLADMLMEYLEVRYPGQVFTGDILYVSVHRQQLLHLRSGVLIAAYAVSTASKGLGAAQDSYRTPTGLHRVNGKHGDGVPLFGILRDREFTGGIADPDFAGQDKDWITTRLLWLDGLEPGVNRGGMVDSRERFIYIHGTANERSIGRPASMGCVRMRNADIVTLFEAVPDGALVVILDN